MSATEDFSIGTVSRLTGISQHTLRVWERRYKAVESGRSEGGRRLYSNDDVERLTLLKALVDRGDRIGQIASEDTDALRARLATYQDHSQTRSELSSGAVKLAVLGETLSQALSDSPPPGTEVVLAETDAERFASDATLAAVDALVIEAPTIQTGSPERIADLRRLARTDRVLVIYGFGRSADIERLVNDGVTVLRSPVDLHAIGDLVGARDAAAEPGADGELAPILPGSVDEGEAPPRRLSAQALQRLARVTTTVECECPHHLVDLVRSLTAFEVYSRQCRNRNEQDAALHAYLHVTTAKARAMIEDALIRTAAAEGIEY
ncbi:MAG: MerR family transcriptional regulator [Gammaproteobacteria bacterium]|jgi:DNA-binding transcriptional MerR regulator